MKNSIRTFVFIIMSGCLSTSCDSYLDVVPDNVPIIDHAFTDKYQAEKFLYTLYSYLPRIGSNEYDGRFDDLTWGYEGYVEDFPHHVLLQNGDRVSEPYTNLWQGIGFLSIRDCNIFLEKIDQVRDLQPWEKPRWIAEAKFLKAYFHFVLLQKYGPVPIIDVNLPVSASNEEMMVERLPVDVVFDYIFRLIDEALPDLPRTIDNAALEMGRLTRPAALAAKAKIAVTAASPLFNGNTDYTSFRNHQDQPFFSDYDHGKWAIAVDACKQAIDACHDAGHGLYTFDGSSLELSYETTQIVQVSEIYAEKWNKEHVWGMTWTPPRGWNQAAQFILPALHSDHYTYSAAAAVGPTMKAAEFFYSKNGVPIEEDKFYDYNNRYEIVTTTDADNIRLVQPNVRTIRLHLNREYRFYGSIIFDGGWMYGIGQYEDDVQWPVNIKNGGASGFRNTARFTPTGYYIKKLYNMRSSYAGAIFNPVLHDFPIIRLADLYLLYAEAINENEGPKGVNSNDLFFYIDEVRKRADLDGVKDSWTNFSNNSEKFDTQIGMRDIIRRERSIELAFECHRFFDLRRWKIAQTELSGYVMGWNYMGTIADDFYQMLPYGRPIQFTDRDILSPIPLSEMLKNKNLVQNPGW